MQSRRSRAQLKQNFEKLGSSFEYFAAVFKTAADSLGAKFAHTNDLCKLMIAALAT
jgi:hypothetical protein